MIYIVKVSNFAHSVFRMTSFHFVFFLRFNMLIMHRLCLVLSITRKVISCFSGTATAHSPSNKEFSLKQYILKSFKTLLVGTYFYSMSKNINKTKKSKINFDLTTDFLINK